MKRIAFLIAAAAILWPAAALAATAPALVGSIANTTSLSGATSVAVSGQYAFATASWPGQLTAVNINNLNQNSPLSSTQTSSASLENGSNITIVGNDAFVVSKNRNASTSINDDGSGNSLTVVDISHPTDPTVVGTPIPDSNQLFGAYGIAVQGQFAYVASQGLLPPPQPQAPDTSQGSFSVVDLLSMQIVGHIDNSSLTGNLANGLDHATSVATSGHYAYVTAFNAGRVTVIDTTTPTAPSPVTSLSDITHLPDPADLAVQGNYLYVANQVNSDQFTVLDISNPADPQWVASITDPLLDGSYRIRVRGDFAYVSASSASTVAAIDISDPTHPRIAGSVTDPALSITTGLDLDPTGRYVIATSPRKSTETNVKLPPYPGSPGGPTNTGTISEIQLDPSPIAVAIAPSSKPPNPTNQTSASFSFTVSDQVSAVRCSLDGRALQPCTTQTTQNYSALGNGSHNFVVEATDAAGTTSTDSYAWTVGPATAGPVNSSPPTVLAATATEGQTLTASAGQWTGSPTPALSYQWRRCDQSGQNCNPISGSTGTSYVAQSADIGSTLEILETATNSAGSGSASSSPTSIVTGKPHVTAAPAISGAARLGAKLTATNGSWLGYPLPAISDRWQRCDSRGSHCKTLSGQTHTTYRVATSDLGARLRLVVTATNSLGSSSASSVVTSVVSAANAAHLVRAAAALAGIARGKPKLQVTLTSVAGGPQFIRVAIAMPEGLGFSVSKRSLVAGITITGSRGIRLRFVPKIAHGSLVLTMRRPTRSLKAQIEGGALKVLKQFAVSVKTRRTGTVRMRLTVTDKRGLTLRSSLRFRVA